MGPARWALLAGPRETSDFHVIPASGCQRGAASDCGNRQGNTKRLPVSSTSNGLGHYRVFSNIVTPRWPPRGRNRQLFAAVKRIQLFVAHTPTLVVEAIPMKAFASLGTAILFLSLGTLVPAFAQHEQEEARPEQKQQQPQQHAQQQSQPKQEQPQQHAQQQSQPKQEQPQQHAQQQSQPKQQQPQQHAQQQSQPKQQQPQQHAQQQSQPKQQQPQQHAQQQAQPKQQQPHQHAQQQNQPKQQQPQQHAQQQVQPKQQQPQQARQQNQNNHQQQQVARQQAVQQPAQHTQEQQRVQQAAWQGHRSENWQSDHRSWEQRGGYHGYRIPDNRYNGYFGPNYAFVIYSQPYMVVGGFPRFQYSGYWFTLVDPWPSYWANNWYQTDDVYVVYANNGYYIILVQISSADLIAFGKKKAESL